jgi:hypothetical protein
MGEEATYSCLQHGYTHIGVEFHTYIEHHSSFKPSSILILKETDTPFSKLKSICSGRLQATLIVVFNVCNSKLRNIVTSCSRIQSLLTKCFNRLFGHYRT